MTSKDAEKLRAKRLANQQAARMGATYRAFEAACGGGPLVGSLYELPVPEQLEWAEKARKAGVALGLVKP